MCQSIISWLAHSNLSKDLWGLLWQAGRWDVLTRPRGQSSGERPYSLQLVGRDRPCLFNNSSNSKFSLTLKQILEVRMKFLQRENAKGSFWSNTKPQATVICKRASLLLIFHLYYLPDRISWLIKLFFLNPNVLSSLLPLILSHPLHPPNSSGLFFRHSSLIYSLNITEYLQWLPIFAFQSSIWKEHHFWC